MSSYTQRVKKEKLQMAKAKARKWKSREKQKRRRLSKQIKSLQALRILLYQYPTLLDQNIEWLTRVFRVFSSLPSCRPEVQFQIVNRIRQNKSLVQSVVSNLQPEVTTVVTDWRQMPEITRTQHMVDFFKSWTPDRLLEFVQLCQQLPDVRVSQFIWGKTDIQIDSHQDIGSIMDLIRVEKVMES